MPSAVNRSLLTKSIVEFAQKMAETVAKITDELS